MPQFSIIIPTLNESENIDLLLTRIFAQNLDPDTFEIIFVDDGSHDGTPDKIRAWRQANVRLIERREKPDLIASILTGVAAAHSDIIVIMDADLSHPPERLRALVDPVINDTYDVTVGSRYIPGGSTENWPLYRQLLSRIGGWIARPICDVNDATSGFFAFRKELVASIPLQAHGYKILLELLMANHGKIRVSEIPICFHDRTHGTSKLSSFHQQAYLQRLIALAGGTMTRSSASRFALVGLLGVVIDVAVFHGILRSGASLASAHLISFLAAVTANYILNSRWSFRESHGDHLAWYQFSRFLIVGTLALMLRGGILALLIDTWNFSPLLAIFPAIIVATTVNYLGAVFYVFPNEDDVISPDIRWRMAAIGIIAFILMLRLVYFGSAQLIPDEAYYWQYAQHMDLSFYDHPPMVAWLIWLGTSLLGHNEFGVRIGALICGFVAIGYLYMLARNLYDKSTAMRSVMLWTILPIGFASGLVMLPDAPLIAAWAATLYYMERALIANQRSAWLGMGIAFGCGILSKYTLGLLGIAALVFVLIDSNARNWLKRPYPYCAALLALSLFSPVIFWNVNNHWASFAFQSNRVLTDGSYDFAVHYLFLYVIILLTPVGFIAAILALFSSDSSSESPIAQRRDLFIKIFTGVPFFVCLVLSTFDQPRFHWTGPIWLAILPTIAWMIGKTNSYNIITKYLGTAWRFTIITCLFAYSLTLHYVTLGIPGIPYQFLAEHYFWQEVAAEVKHIAEETHNKSGKEPIIVGMSKWSVASALAFYTHGISLDIRSRNLFGGAGSMYEFWYPTQAPTDRPIIQVGMKRQHLENIQLGQSNHDIKEMLDHPGEIKTQPLTRHGTYVRQFYYRISNGFKGTVAICNIHQSTDLAICKSK